MNRLSKYLFALVAASVCSQAALATTPTASMITAGGYHTCVLTDATPPVECWGDGQFGQIGSNGVSTAPYSKSTPVAVSGLSSGTVTALAAGYDHTCALVSGEVECWGYNDYGELGNNDSQVVSSSTPATVLTSSNPSVSLSGVSAIGSGASSGHTCASTSSSVLCWGANSNGQLGNDSVTQSSYTPVSSITGLSDVALALATGAWHTCAVTSVGAVECWGDNSRGQVGNGDAVVDNAHPIGVAGFGGAAVRNDYDGDGLSDVLFLDTTTGGTLYWKDADKSQAVYPGKYDTSYTYAGSGDFNADGKADLFFTKASNHGTMIWNGAIKSSATYPGSSNAGFVVAAICDVNGDGHDDVIWFNPTTGGTQVWNGAVKASISYPGTQATGFSLAACGDFDGDGKADLFWRNNTTGADEIWPDANKSAKIYPGSYPDSAWTVIGAGEVNGDGKADAVWYHAPDGKTMIWETGLKSSLATTYPTYFAYPGSNNTSFTPAAIGYYSGYAGGVTDLLWVNSDTGGTQMWSGFYKPGTYPGTYPAGYSVQK